MSDNSKRKPLFITLLLTLMLFSITCASLVPTAHAAEPNIQDKTLSVLSEVVGLRTELYTVSQSSQRDSQYISLAQEEADLYLSSAQSKLRVSCSFVSHQLREVYLCDCQGELALKQPATNTVDMAKGLLERYQNYVGDSFYGKLASMLNDVDANVNSTKSAGNIKLEVVSSDQKIIDYIWTYTDENGIIAKRKNVILSYERGRLKGFLNNWPLYTVVGKPKISAEEATAIALEASKDFSYQVTYNNGTVKTISGFKIASESLGHATLSYLNFPNQSLARGGDPFVLYPSWYVPLGFDKFYPGDVGSMTVSIWADTGEVSIMGPVVVDSGMASSVAEAAEETTTAEQTIAPEVSQGSTTLSAPIVIAAIFSVVGISLGSCRKVKVTDRRKLFSRFWTGLLCASVLFSVMIVTVPEASADIPTPNSKSRIYAALDTDPPQLPAEAGNATEMCEEIEADFNSAGYSTDNLCGSGTTWHNVVSNTWDDEHNYHRAAVFHFGHRAYTGYQDNTGLPYNAITPDLVLANTALGKHFFVFLWVCDQANSPTYGMPYAWSHRQDMSDDGYDDPDGSGQCFIGFDNLSPIISGYYPTFDPEAGDGPCRSFVESFYDYALHEGYSVKQSLDMASDGYFGCYYSSSIFNQGYDTWYPPWGNYSDGCMKVFGDGDIYLIQYDFTVLTKGGNDYFSNKDVYIDNPYNIANTGSGNPITITGGYHTFAVNDFWESGYTGYRYYFDHYSDGTYWEWYDNVLTFFFNEYHDGWEVTAHFTKEYRPGDVDGDRDADQADWNYFIGSYPSTRGDYTYDYDSKCDFNGDGDVDYGDYSYLCQILFPSSPWVTVPAYDDGGSPINTEVYIDGVYAGTTGNSFIVKQGNHGIGVAVPSGYVFRNFTCGGNTYYDNPHTFSISSSTTVTAYVGEPREYWLTISAVDMDYYWTLYPQVYIDSSYVGTAPVSVQVQEGWHTVQVEDPYYNMEQYCYEYFWTFSDNQWANPTDVYVSSDTGLTAYYSSYGFRIIEQPPTK